MIGIRKEVSKLASYEPEEEEKMNDNDMQMGVICKETSILNLIQTVLNFGNVTPEINHFKQESLWVLTNLCLDAGVC
jgi:hypothetical protein